MKKLLTIIAVLSLTASAMAQGVLTATLSSGLNLVSTNRIRIYSIELTSTNAYTYKIWDNDNTSASGTTPGFWGTNFINGAYVSRSTYPTSYVNSYVSPPGFTNWYTNAGIWGVTITNAASTNALSPLYSISTAGAETRVVYADILCTRGVVIGANGNGTATIYYRQEQ